MSPPHSFSVATILLLTLSALLAILPSAYASTINYISTTDTQGKTIVVPDDRRPALYTGNFGDCLGGSLVNVSRFDAAFYADNATVTFHLQGSSALVNESIMMFIGVYAYGESRFDLTFNPCSANIASLCPMTSAIPISAGGLIPLGPADTATIPTIALSIPDFEGQAILRLFANSTQSEIGCFSAVITNGRTFSHPSSVGTILGLFTLLAVCASFATAIYGDSIPVIRTHYAHSLSVLVVFSVWQHIFFTGSLSMNWPPVLVAWWSNFAWAGGMINTASMQRSINNLIGNNVGNTSQVGAAGADTTQESLGGGYDLAALYKRADLGPRDGLAEKIFHTESRDLIARGLTGYHKRDFIPNGSEGYNWYGKPVGAGLPLPGNYSGFAGTLAEEGIRTSNAFLTGFLWFLILLVILTAAVTGFKWFLEALVRFNTIKSDRLHFFRANWKTYTVLTALRTCAIGFFMLMFLTIFQFTYTSPSAVKGIAALIFLILFLGMVYCAFYAFYYRAREASVSQDHSPSGKETADAETPVDPSKSQRIAAFITNILPRHRTTGDNQKPRPDLFRAIRRLPALGAEPQSIHDDEFYLTRFGWLTARYRRSRWWFFGAWLLYEFIRACFYAGASGHALVQVFGLLIVESIAFGLLIWIRPFEGKRLNLLVVYMLGFSKVMSVALSAAFDVRFNLPRIICTVIGVVVIVIQGVLAVMTLIAIVVGAVSSYMSLTRNREEFHPRSLASTRVKYFKHLDRSAREERPTPPPTPPPETTTFKDPYFNVGSVRRLNKIEDDDPDFAAEMHMSRTSLPVVGASGSPTTYQFPAMTEDGGGSARRSRATSVNSLSKPNLPFGARPHRPSWSSRDFQELQATRSTSASIHQTENTAARSGLVSLTGSGADAIARPKSPLNPSGMSSPAPTPRPRSPLTVPRSVSPALVDSETARSRSPFSLLGRSRTPAGDNNNNNNNNNHNLRAASSHDTLRGAHVHDSIGAVPSPAVRPRSGTWSSSRPGSRNQSRVNTPTASTFNLDVNTNTADGAAESSKRGRAPLTPAVEGDEETFAKLDFVLQDPPSKNA